MDKKEPTKEDETRAKPMDDIRPGMDQRFDRAVRQLENLDKGKINDKTIQRQRCVIGVLKNEQKEILNNLNVCRSTYHVNYNNRTISGITNLLQEVSNVHKNIHTEKANIADLDSQIDKTRFLVLEARKDAMKSKNNESCPRENVINGLENRLHAYKVRLNETLKENKKLREDIDLSLRTRAQFNKKYNALIKNLNTGKRVLEDLLDQSENVYNQREKLMMRLAKLKEKNQRSVKLQREQMYELVRNKLKEKDINKFINDKNQDRSHLFLNKTERFAVELDRCQTEKKINSYRQLLDAIYNYNTKNVGNNVDMIKHYKQEEVNIFQLLLFNNELKDELQVLEQDLNVKMDQYMERNDNIMDEQFHQSTVISSLNAELAEVKNNTINVTKQVKYHRKVLEDLLKGIEELFNIGGCEQWSLLQLLGDNTKVTNYNYKLFLNLIEEKILEILKTGQFPLIPVALPVTVSPSPSAEGFPGIARQTSISHNLVASTPCLFCLSPKLLVGGDDKVKIVTIP